MGFMGIWCSVYAGGRSPVLNPSWNTKKNKHTVNHGNMSYVCSNWIPATLIPSNRKWCLFSNHLIIGRWGAAEGSIAVLWWCEEFLAVSRHPVVIFTILLRHPPRKGYEVYRRRPTVLLTAPQRFPLELLLPYAVAHSAEGGAEQDEEAHAQDGQEDPTGGTRRRKVKI